MKKYVIWTMVLGTLISVLTACGLDIPKEVPSSYETITVEKQDITIPMKFSAKLKGQTDVTITPQVSGQLMQICVKEGQQVKKGQTLFVIDSRNAQLELQAAQANLKASIAQEKSARLEYESNKNLFEKKIVSQYLLDTSENAYSQAQAAVDQARASVDRAKVNLGFCTITAMVAGVIGEIPVRIGDQVSPVTHLTILSGNTVMDAEFSVTENLIESSISAGLSQTDKAKHIAALPDATFMMKNGAEYPYKGRITSITGMVDAATGSLGVKATFPNPDGHLFSGIQGTVVLPMSQKDVMVVPQTAVVRQQDRQLVYKVLADSTATAITVTTTSVGNGKDVIVMSGLNVGDRIVAVGAKNVQEGERVLFPEEVKSDK